MDVTTLRSVGKSNLELKPLGFGGGTIGDPKVSNEDSLLTVQAAFKEGVRFFDTAPWYGVGRSERRLGLALSGITDDRESYRINTKIGKTLLPEAERDDANKTFSPGGQVRTVRDARSGFRVTFNYSYDAIMGQHYDSLQRLGHANVDSLTIHDIDWGYHSEEQLAHHLKELSRTGGGGARALEELRDNGIIQAIGCGCNLEARNRYSWDDSKHEDLAERIADLVDLDFFVIAGAYTLLETRAMRRILPLCVERNIGCIGATPYAAGWLVSPDNNATYMYDTAPQDIIEKSNRMQEICREYETPLAAAAIQFQLAHESFAAIIPGAKSPDEVTENNRLLAFPVPAGVWEDFKHEGLLDPAAPTPD